MLHGGRPSATLADVRAAVAWYVEEDVAQELMARVTGNYKHGNERTAKDHLQNKGR